MPSPGLVVFSHSMRLECFIENDQCREVPVHPTTWSSPPQQSLAGYYTPVPKSPGLRVRHQRLPTNFRLLTLYPSHVLPSRSLLPPVHWSDVSNTRPVERARRHLDARELGLLIRASMYSELVGMSELLCEEVSHAYQIQYCRG